MWRVTYLVPVAWMVRSLAGSEQCAIRGIVAWPLQMLRVKTHVMVDGGAVLRLCSHATDEPLASQREEDNQIMIP